MGERGGEGLRDPLEREGEGLREPQDGDGERRGDISGGVYATLWRSWSLRTAHQTTHSGSPSRPRLMVPMSTACLAPQLSPTICSQSTASPQHSHG